MESAFGRVRRTHDSFRRGDWLSTPCYDVGFEEKYIVCLVEHGCLHKSRQPLSYYIHITPLSKLSPLHAGVIYQTLILSRYLLTVTSRDQPCAVFSCSHCTNPWPVLPTISPIVQHHDPRQMGQRGVALPITASRHHLGEA